MKMKLTIEGTREEIASVLAGIKKEESPQKNHVLTTEYGCKPQESPTVRREEIIHFTIC